MHRWALAIGRTVRELEASVTSEEVTEMMAYARLEPFGPLQDDFRFGQLCALIFNINRDQKAEARGPGNFFPSLARFEKTEPVHVADPAEQSRLLREALGRADGGKK